MQKILIIGPPGSGKSTFSIRLGEIIKLPVIHLDKHFFQDNWTDPDRAQYQLKVEELCDSYQWIMEGGYGSTLDHRLLSAKTIIYLDESGWTCFKRIISRNIKYYGKTRPSMAPNCPERFSISFLYSILIHNWIKRPAILQKLSLLDDNYDVHVLSGAIQQEQYLNEIRL